jgi:hypothetical protein
MLHALVLSAVVAAAPAQNAAALNAEAPLAVQVARELVTPELWDASLGAVIPQVAGQIREMVTHGGGTVDDGIEGAIRELYDLAIPFADVVDLQAGLLEKNFTQAELLELRTFYRTPLGRKVIARMPGLTADAMAAGMDKMRSRQGEFERVLAPHIHMPVPGVTAPAPAAAQ